ncbi:MBL fold metallo-hydrolase [Brevibacillus porteri]|uniref:Rhodanese domain-containing protein n=1 Tax=Brevibacillus porteri TaxID=2126350 RepID=A0ABX5FHH5_9BACL|nr:MBL fold metallo-hydrolase [Brevibacillus porteri]MED1801967.1 MBL fold metallo-hydrolase [Brevibacillus porteri]MED2132528.1 MBL fold metallo-hydrolase [Brevibacillus porteri]MED2745407.1 MBL fold metallo-hydrolase [Brevibacillus porteri]MED2814316.1 MBL fold metallo-hydrolase [Brevibacillus porteri]MED2892564.1 MBL fold metallo-hydrolase [Brevibacillus porteri]
MMEQQTSVKAMTAHELTQLLFAQEELFILDVRNTSDYEAWQIEGHRVVSMNIPYFDLLDGVEAVLEKIPVKQKVLVVCAKEGSSIFVAEMLAEAGFTDVSYLQGGMKAWSEHLEPVKVGDLRDGGAIYQFVRIGKGCLSYMIVSGGEAAVVDTLRMTDVYEAFAAKHQWTIKHTIDTHLHADHISGGKKLADRLDASYWLPEKDAEEVTYSYRKLEEGQEIQVGATKIAILPIYSPGHTIGSTSLIVDDTYFLTGDSLFVASIGRPDLAGKAEDWVGDLHNTLYNRYKELPEHLVVLPAHFGNYTELGPMGTVSARLGDLYRNNPGLTIADESEFRHIVTHHLPPQPNAYQEIRQVNMGKLKPSEEEQQEMEVGPNRCAIHDK